MQRGDWGHPARIPFRGWAFAAALLVAMPALSWYPRDIEFDCPCSAEWNPDPSGQGGELTLHVGLLSHRSTDSGSVRLDVRSGHYGNGHGLSTEEPFEVGPIAAKAGISGLTLTRNVHSAGPTPERFLWVRINERASGYLSLPLHWQEHLTLWPVPNEDESGRVEFVDILTDSDADGVGDVNERIAGTLPNDDSSTPGKSTIDLLALFTATARDNHDADWTTRDSFYTRMHHQLTVVNSMFVDSGTNLLLRTVGFSEVEADESGLALEEKVEELMERHGADITYQFNHGAPNPCGGAGGCALTKGFARGYWNYGWATGFLSNGASTTAHELGHVMGLVHSARQGEADGVFRWARGHYLAEPADPKASYARWGDSNWRYSPPGTIMTYSRDQGTVFSDPDADCGEAPCGVARDHADGADAVASLGLMRFRVAAHRESKPDSDDDGIVDDADIAPDDPDDWNDIDGDGVGDNADPDDDNDGVDDEHDPFPYDPDEWEDLDGDGIGDNADDDVEDLAPFRDPALRALVERALGKGAGASITAEDLETLTVLRGRGVRDLSGLEHATGLHTLELTNGLIKDLSPLADLSALEQLGLASNKVQSVAALSGLTSLHTLNLTSNDIGDVSDLSGLTNLQRLYVERNSIADLQPLSELQSLTAILLSDNAVTDLSPLSSLAELQDLRLIDNAVSDLAPLSGLTRLQRLYLTGNAIPDLLPLSELTGLQLLYLDGNAVTDLSPLSGLDGLLSLRLDDNAVSDLSPLSGLTQLQYLHLSGNAVSDLSPLSGLTGLSDLRLAVASVSDLRPLAGLQALGVLDLTGNAIRDVAPIEGLTRLRTLHLDSNHVSDLTPLSGLGSLSSLHLGANDVSLHDVLALPNAAGFRVLGLAHLGISDLAPLTALTGIRRLNLRGNKITDIGPLVDPLIWSTRGYVQLEGNPLDEVSVTEHKPKLESMRVTVRYDETDASPRVSIPDPNLRALVAQQRAYGDVHVDDPITESSLWQLYVLVAFNGGVSDLTGLEAATNLDQIYLGSNEVSDLTPLANLSGLSVLYLTDNRVSDLSPLAGSRDLWHLGIAGNRVSDLSPLAGSRSLQWLDIVDNLVTDLSPLVENAYLADGDQVVLSGNPLSEESLNKHIPALIERSVWVTLRSISLAVPSGRETTFDVAAYFDALLGSSVVVTAESDDPDIASAEMQGGVLTMVAGMRTGEVAVTLTARGNATTTTLTVNVTVAHAKAVAMYPAASDRSRQGFLRVINRSDEAGAVFVRPVDDAGVAASRVTLAMNQSTTTHFNSDDLESGNRTKRLSGAASAGDGDWRLELVSGLDIDVLSYVRTSDGFLTSMHDVAPDSDGDHRVAIFNPGSNINQVSRLRLINPGDEAAAVTIRGIDDDGASPGTVAELSVLPGAARMLSAAELEAGDGVDGSLGDGRGKWSLTVSSDQPIRVMSLLESPGGHLTNLSTVPAANDDVHSVPLFPAASDELGRQGFARVINRGDTAAEVSIAAFDETNREYEAITLTVGANEAVHFNSDDLELGNDDKGLTGSTGAGEGDWRLELTSEADIEVLSYVRTTDGFLTSMHDVVSGEENRHEVPIFNPGRNTDQVSRLRLINAGGEPAQVTIVGIDDAGRSPGDAVQISIPAGSVRSFTSAELESGAADSKGALGVGEGKWRLIVESDQPITVVNLLESPTGHLTNLSTVPANRVFEEANAAGG